MNYKISDLVTCNEILIVIMLLTSTLVSAQNDSMPKSTTENIKKPEPKFTAAIDVVYPYLWRGLRYNGDRVAFQSSLNYAISEKLSFGLWATTNFSNAADAYNEYDWSISYQLTSIMSVMLSDYYWPATKKSQQEDGVNSRDNYFDYSEGSAQTLDVSLVFDFSEKGVPLDFLWSTLIGGNDYNYDNEGNSTTRAFSSYAEIGYTHSFITVGIDVRPFAGAAVINGGYYGIKTDGSAGISFTNVGVNVAKEIKITKDYNLPVFVGFSHNDYGVQQFDKDGNLTKTIRNFFSCGVTFTLQ